MIAFTAPWALAALTLLPAIWWLLRVTPPAPRRLDFPALALLRGLIVREETAARTPWPLLLLRLLIAALIILGLAGPLLNPDRATAPAAGPLVVVVDNGWASARDWPARLAALDRLLRAAERRNRNVALIPAAPPADGGGVKSAGLLTPADARRLARTLTPQPWPADRLAAAAAVRSTATDGPGYGVWLSDGLAGPGTAELAAALQRLGAADVAVPAPDALPRLLAPGDSRGARLSATIIRAAAIAPESVVLRAQAEDGRLLAREAVTLALGETRREVFFTLPAELRNQAQSLRIENEAGAGATALLDDRWRRRPVGLVSGRPDGDSQPLLSDLHYLRRALEPFTEVRAGDIAGLLSKELSMLVLSDVGALTAAEQDRLTDWLRGGGLLVRFAGPRLSQTSDPLIPVRLRAGDRALGGAMSWSEPMALAPFDAASPFAGLTPPADVRIQRQVLAEPTPDLAARTWARLVDGVPMATYSRLGDGRIVLIHTSASPDWSNLPLSGLFVEMLQRLVAVSQGVTAGGGEALAAEPAVTLDGFGRLDAPPATAMPLPATASGAPPPTVSPNHPPGLYGQGEARRALNLSATVRDIQPLGALPSGVGRLGYDASAEMALQPWLLAAAMALLALDLLAALWLRGYLRGGRTGLAAALLACLLALNGGGMNGGAAQAAELPPAPGLTSAAAVAAITETVLAWVKSGDRAVDADAEAGLRGLRDALNRRTAIETAAVAGVDVEQDELAFYPLLYWPLSSRQPALSDGARARVDAYLRHGGVILFDTRDGGGGLGGGTGAAALRRVLDGVAVPPLAPLTSGHVLTKSFYLMQEFPGRRAGGPVWVEADEGGRNDGVSSVVIGGHDWAAAWAIDETGMALYPVVPGGERQREMAYRFGVNLMMYALTGNYKADQVHVPAILERLGQ